MFMSIVNGVVEYHVAAMRSAGLVAFCRARGSEVEAAQVVLDCPDGTGVTYDGLLAPSPITLYPSVPYTDFQLPCVVVSILTNVSARRVAAACRRTSPKPPHWLRIPRDSELHVSAHVPHQVDAPIETRRQGLRVQHRPARIQYVDLLPSGRAVPIQEIQRHLMCRRVADVHVDRKRRGRVPGGRDPVGWIA